MQNADGCLEFCNRFSVHPPFPAQEQPLAAFVAFLYRERLTGGTVKSYLAAIRYSQIALGLGDPMMGEMRCLEYVVRGLKRLAGRPRRTRLPITPSILGESPTIEMQRCCGRQPPCAFLAF